MRFITAPTAGAPEVMSLTTGPLPAFGLHDVLIRVSYAGVNRPDLAQRSGNYAPPPGASPIMGLEVAGEIVAHGENMLEAAGVPENFFTVWVNVFDTCQLKAGEKFLVHGGSSGIGLTAIQLAKSFSAEVFTTVGNDDKAAFCKKIGADYVFNYKMQDWMAEIAAITQKKGVNVILDMVGGSYIEKNLRSLALEGRYCFIAFLEGGKAEVDFRPLMMKRQTITGSTLRARPDTQKAAIAAALEARVWPLLASGKVKPVVYKTFTLEHVVEAHRLMESSVHIGKIMLKVAD